MRDVRKGAVGRTVGGAFASVLGERAMLLVLGERALLLAIKTVWDSKLQTIVKNVQFPDAQRWFEGFLDPLIANNRAFCPRASKTHDFSRSAIAKAGAPKCPRGQNQRLFADSLPVRGERRSC